LELADQNDRVRDGSGEWRPPPVPPTTLPAGSKRTVLMFALVS
jgi:hypothetical protein